MRILVVNYEMDDRSPVLAWQAGVVRELARRTDRVAVLTERAGQCALPGNVAVRTMPRAGRAGAIGRRAAALGAAWRLARHERAEAVFVHMAHRQAYRLWPVFRLLRLPVLLWYAHGAVTWHLRLAHRSVDRVISSSPDGFRLRSARAHFIGQGVDTQLFSLRPPAAARPHLLAVGRVSRRKRLDLLVSMMAHLRGDGLTLRIIGPTLTGDDVAYEAALRRDVTAGQLPVEFLGPVSVDRLPALYDTAAVALNVSETRSMDKAVLEALATGCPVLSSNPAFRELLVDHPDLVVRDERPEAIAAHVRTLVADRGAAAPEELRRLVEGRHDIRSYADRVLAHLEAVIRR